MLKEKQLYDLLDNMSDNLMNSVSSSDYREAIISEFKTWLSLSFIGGLFDISIYDEVKSYGLAKINEHFDEFEREERLLGYV